MGWGGACRLDRPRTSSVSGSPLDTQTLRPHPGLWTQTRGKLYPKEPSGRSAPRGLRSSAPRKALVMWDSSVCEGHSPARAPCLSWPWRGRLGSASALGSEAPSGGIPHPRHDCGWLSRRLLIPLHVHMQSELVSSRGPCTHKGEVSSPDRLHPWSLACCSAHSRCSVDARLNK